MYAKGLSSKTLTRDICISWFAGKTATYDWKLKRNEKKTTDYIQLQNGLNDVWMVWWICLNQTLTIQNITKRFDTHI